MTLILLNCTSDAANKLYALERKTDKSTYHRKTWKIRFFSFRIIERSDNRVSAVFHLGNHYKMEKNHIANSTCSAAFHSAMIVRFFWTFPSFKNSLVCFIFYTIIRPIHCFVLLCLNSRNVSLKGHATGHRSPDPFSVQKLSGFCH